MKILLFGRSGQLGSEIVPRAEKLHFDVVSPVLSELDITDEQGVESFVAQVKPDIILNCAAYTAVDDAEEDRPGAFSVNASAPRYLAQAAKKSGTRLIHLSTDYVFDGSAKEPYTEESPTLPINVYGESKLAGEQGILEVLGDSATIVRTSSLHGQHGANFVHTMLELFALKETLSVVTDQIMSPTWAGWLAGVLLDLCRIKEGGIYHACSGGAVSWFDFAQEILRLADGDFSVELEPVPASTFPRPAARPAYSVMSCDKLTKLLGRAPLSWNDGLQRHLRDIKRLKGE